jgi:hypothetical protein
MYLGRVRHRRQASGIFRLVGHCEALARALEDGHAPARMRLEVELGPELATRLVCALARRPRTTF